MTLLQRELLPTGPLQCFLGQERVRCPREEDQGQAKGREEAEARQGWEMGAAGPPQLKSLDAAWSRRSQIHFQACFSHGSSGGSPGRAINARP